MSLAATIWAWRQKTPGSTAKLVLLALADRVRAAGVCWPSHQEIADDCQLSARAVFDALKNLEAEGCALITRSRRMQAGKRLTDLIQLNLSEIRLFEGGPGAEEGTTESANANGSDPTKSASAESPSDLSDEPSASSVRNLLPHPDEPSATQVPCKPVKQPVESAPAPEVDLTILASRIYDAGTDNHRLRCGEDPSKIVFALQDCIARGDDPLVVTDAMVAFVTSGDQTKQGGRYSSAPHRAIMDNRWVPWKGRGNGAPASRDLNRSLAPITEIECEGQTWAIPPGGQTDKVGTYALPGIARQLSIMDRWSTKRLADWDDRKWGPPPGAPGCRLWQTVLDRFPHESMRVASDAEPQGQAA